MPATGAFRNDLIQSNWLCSFVRRMGRKGRRVFLALAVALVGKSSGFTAVCFVVLAEKAGSEPGAVGESSVLRLFWLRRNGLFGGCRNGSAEDKGTGRESEFGGSGDTGVSGIISAAHHY